MAGKAKGKGKDKDAKSKDKGKDKNDKKTKKGEKDDGSKGEGPVLSNIKDGTDFFRFPNHDIYVGGYRATIDRTIHRQGLGLYLTKKCESYKGEWDNDVLTGQAKILYEDGSSYFGKVKEFKYNGEGVYKFPNQTEMKCEFVNNRPINGVVVIDPTGHFWKGTAEKDGVKLSHVNHYLLNLKQRLEAVEQEQLEAENKINLPESPLHEIGDGDEIKQNLTSSEILALEGKLSKSMSKSGVSSSGLVQPNKNSIPKQNSTDNQVSDNSKEKGEQIADNQDKSKKGKKAKKK